MSIDRLKYFATVVETKNLRKAAEIVGITAPSMSKAISVLEDELGHKLLYPEGRGIDITPKGMEIYRASLALLDEYQQFHKRLKNVTPAEGQLKIATFEVFSSYFMASFICQEESLEVLMLEMEPGRIEQSILDGTVDFGLTYIPSPEASLDYIEVGSFKMGIFGQKKWAKTDFHKWPFAIPTTELKIYASDADALDMWPKKAPARWSKYRFELLETALQTSRQGSSVIHCPDFIVKLHNHQIKPEFKLECLPLPDGYKAHARGIKVYLVSRKGMTSSKLERKLAKFFRSLN